MSDLFYDPSAPVQANQYADEFGRLLELFKGMEIRRALEIGCFTGGSLYQFIKRMGAGGVMVAVDLPGAKWGMEGTQAVADWRGWGKEIGVTVVPMLGDSQSQGIIGAVHAFAPFDFVFLDGDHSYEGVKRDWEIYGKLVKPGGVVAIHDIVPHIDEEIGVYRLWEELRNNYRTVEYITKPGQAERGIGVIYV